MSRQNTPARGVHFPNDAQPDRAAAEHGLALLHNWRSGSAATAIVMSGLLPFGIAWRDTHLIAIAAATSTAAILAIGVHVARRRWLTTLALSPDLAGPADLAAERRRLQSHRTRHALAAGLRRTADPNQPPSRFDPCPVLADRAQPLRAELLDLGDALEQRPPRDPASVALPRELLMDGTSTLYNPNHPADELQTTLNRARAGIHRPTHRLTHDSQKPRVATRPTHPVHTASPTRGPTPATTEPTYRILDRLRAHRRAQARTAAGQRWLAIGHQFQLS